MIRLTQAIVAVMSCTLAAGAAGGIVGAAVGRLAPSFVRWLVSPGGGGEQSIPPSSASAWASSAACSSASAPASSSSACWPSATPGSTGRGSPYQSSRPSPSRLRVSRSTRRSSASAARAG